MVALQPSFRDAQKKSYTVEKAHPGNSYIHFLLEGSALFGSIQTIFTTDQIPNTTFAPVALFVEVEQKGTRIDPYRKISSLHYQLLTRPKTPKTIVICVKHVIGHVAVLTNVSGVFGLDTETISVAIVHHLSRRRNTPPSSELSDARLPESDQLEVIVEKPVKKAKDGNLIVSGAWVPIATTDKNINKKTKKKLRKKLKNKNKPKKVLTS
ncbi:hypothetical protein H4Q26_006296 [Puccinia striiformis f. sp. tritici PST-130]|nr:hypothetical protein H4Q26_006296 [Puccinia striiformis f. sp. tritici PST-130]